MILQSKNLILKIVIARARRSFLQKVSFLPCAELLKKTANSTVKKSKSSILTITLVHVQVSNGMFHGDGSGSDSIFV